MTEQQLSMIEEIKSIAEAQLGDWLGVEAFRQPAEMHHWQEVYDYACQTADWERDQLAQLKRDNERMSRELAALPGVDTIRELKRKIDDYRRLLHDVDQCAPAVLKVSGLGLDFATALQAVRDEMEDAS